MLIAKMRKYFGSPKSGQCIFLDNFLSRTITQEERYQKPAANRILHLNSDSSSLSVKFLIVHTRFYWGSSNAIHKFHYQKHEIYPVLPLLWQPCWTVPMATKGIQDGSHCCITTCLTLFTWFKNILVHSTVISQHCVHMKDKVAESIKMDLVL